MLVKKNIFFNFIAINTLISLIFSFLFISSAISATPSVAAGESHSLVLTNEGNLWGWGRNGYGQLGNGATTDSSPPVQTSNLTGVSDFAAGQYHSIALKSDGTVWAWGSNIHGVGGEGSSDITSTPEQVSGLSDVSGIGAGDTHSLAVKNDGSVWTWGDNTYGQLGDGTTTTRPTPVQVHELSDVSAVVGGFYSSIALKNDGTVWAWGINSNGQLGDGSTTNHSTPVQVSGLSGISSIAVGPAGNHILALKNDGTVWAWGWNYYGQLGDGTTTNRSTPVQVSNLSDVSQISNGYTHSLALKSDGTVWTWGSNGAGQLGDETRTNRSTPVQVSNLSGVSAIAGGGSHSVALKNDGTARAWGSNNYEQLGIGAAYNSSTPVQVLDLSATASLTWNNNVAAGFTWSTPIVLDDRVFLQDQDGGFDAFSISDGSKLYTKDVANAFPTNSPIFANGFIYMIADGLRKIDPANGNEVGHFANTSISSQSPAALNNLVIVGDSSTVYGIDVNTMAQVWSNDLGATSSIDVAISDDILYVFADKLYALDPVTGSEYWSVTPPENNGLYIGAVGSGYLSVFENDSFSTQLHTYQLNASRTTSPTLVWSADMGAGSADRSPPAIDGNLVFATSRVGVLKAFELSGDGTALWEKTVRSNGSASALPLATNGVVVIQEEVSSNVFQLAGYNGLSGTEIFRTAITGMGIAWGQPTIKDHVVYLATDQSGALYAVSVPGLAGQWTMIKGNAQLTGSSVSGVESQVDETTLTIDIPQLHVPGMGVFRTELTLVDEATLEFNLNAANVSAVNVASSEVATFDEATSQLEIPAMIYQGARYNVTFRLSSAIGDNYRFVVIEAAPI